jgi:hypothetical protein
MKNHFFCRLGIFTSSLSLCFGLLVLSGFALEAKADQVRGGRSSSPVLEDGSGPSPTTLITTARTVSATIEDFRDSRALWRALGVEEAYQDSAVTKTLVLRDSEFELSLRCAQARQLSCQVSLALKPDSKEVIAPELGSPSKTFRLSHFASEGLFERLSLPVERSLDPDSSIHWERKLYATHDQALLFTCQRSSQGGEVLSYACNVKVTWSNGDK